MCALAQADPRAFWRTFKATRQKALNAITPQQWSAAFQDLYNPAHPEATSASISTQQAPDSCPCKSRAGDGALNGISNHQADSAITPAEVAAAPDILKRHKAAGIDSILPDILKDGKSSLVQPFCCLLNKILEEGLLSMGVIRPISKKGDPNDPA